MSSTRNTQIFRELSWDSIPSQSDSEHRSLLEPSHPMPEDTPSFGWTTSGVQTSSSVAAGPITPRTSPPHLTAAESLVGDLREPNPTKPMARALTFDSIDSDVEVLESDVEVIDSDVEVVTPARVTPSRIEGILQAPINSRGMTSRSTVPKTLTPPKVFSSEAQKNQLMSWRHVSDQLSSSAPASSEVDESSDVDVETSGSLGDSDTQMSDLQFLKLELEDAPDADIGAPVSGEDHVEDSSPDTFRDVKGVDTSEEVDSDLEIIEADDMREDPKFKYGKASYLFPLSCLIGLTSVLFAYQTHKAIAALVKQQAAQSSLKNGRVESRFAPRILLRPDTTTHSLKRAKPVSPQASLTETPLAKRKRMAVLVELPTQPSLRVPRSSQAPPCAQLSKAQVTGKNTQEDRNGLHDSMKLGESTCDFPGGQAAENVPESRRGSAKPQENMAGQTGTSPLKTKGNVEVEAQLLQEDEEVIEEAEMLDDDGAWTSAAGSHSRESIEPLSNCIKAWAVGCNWETENENDSNPIWDLINSPLMGEHVMDHTVAYLVYHAKLMETLSHRRVCLVPASLYGAMDQIEHTGTTRTPATPELLHQLLIQRGMVWTEPKPPSRIIMPVVDHPHMHCYLWYGDIKQKPGRKLFNCELKYLDSLARPSKQLLDKRFSLAKAMLKALVPQIDGEVTYSYELIDGYRQDPNTLDCGYFVCQAVSALAFHRDEALRTLQPVALVKTNVKQILEACADRALLRLSNGLVAKEPILLHGSRRIAPPPWTRPKATTPPPRKQPPRWTTPEYTRSLSEARETPQTICKRRPTPLGWQAVFGRLPSPSFEQIDPESAARYLEHLGEHNNKMPLGILEGVSGAAPMNFLEALFLRNGDRRRVRWLPGISIVNGGDEEELERPEDCLSLYRTCEALSYLRRGQERSRAVLTGSNAGHTIRMDWTKDSLELEEDWLSASLDVDSLSLTARDPKFTMPAVLHAYPPRASTLTTDNGLSVDVNNVKTPLSHIPNFTFLNIGQNNQFRVNLFFPRYEKGQDNGNRYITIMDADDYKTWYEQVVLQALQRLGWNCPNSLYNSYIRLNTALPKTYATAESHCVNGPRSFTGYKVTHEILNLLLANARDIVNETPSLARFGNFFYHIVGMNLKAVCEAIPERSKGNPMLHVLQQYPIVDWSAQNYCDIAVDVGLEINICRDKLPLDLDDITLVWKLDTLRDLVASSWRKPHMDAYMHSHVVGGLSAKPKSHIAASFFSVHFYMKDKLLTYIHRDNSIGTGFSPEHGMQGALPYETQTRRLQEVWADGCGCYGGRVEWRVGLRTANDILQQPPNLWLRRFMSAEAIVAVRTRDVVRMKTIMLDSYKWFFTQIQRLSSEDRQSLPVGLLASVLTYLIQGLVSAPGEMSSHRSMVKDLHIISRARRFGIASIPQERLGPDWLRMSGPVTVDRYPILKYIARKNPAGARIKHSSLLADEEKEPESGLATESVGSTWSDEDQKWVEELVNRKLANWLWTCLPMQDQRQNGLQAARRGPFRVSNWQRVAGEGVKYKYRAAKNGFNNVHKELFPPNWVLQDKGKHWATLQDQVLDPILERIDGAEPGRRAQYSAQIRRAISDLIKQWEFLPSAQKKTIWAYSGTGRVRSYMLYKNPQFTGSRAQG